MSKMAKQILIPHDGGEAFVCRGCMTLIDPVGGNYPGWTRGEADEAKCPHCGGADTAWSFADQECELSVGDLWLYANQGLDARDRKFGYIGTDDEYEDEDGDSTKYCGWFFTWVGDATTEDGRKAIIDSLETDETNRHNEEIPHELAVEKLTAYLDKKYPLADEGE